MARKGYCRIGVLKTRTIIKDMKDLEQKYLENRGSVESSGWGHRGCLSNHATGAHRPAAHGDPRGLRGTEHVSV